MQSLSYSPNESNDTDEQPSDYANYNPRASIPSASVIQPKRRSHSTKSAPSAKKDRPTSSTPQAAHELPVDTSHIPGHALTSLNRTMSQAQRRHYLASVIAACTPEDLMFVSETVTPLLKRDFLYQLPVELAFHILSFVDDVQTIIKVSQVCKYWYRVARDDSVWRRLCAIYGFNDCEEAEQEYQRTEKRRREGREKRKEVARKLHSDEDQEQEEARRRRHSEHAIEYSFRRHFKHTYIIQTNWRKGGKLLKAHHLPIVSPDVGTVTSIALDSDWVIVGFANAMIKIFSANKGVLCRTLVGHKSGVWSVCLVSEGGYRLSDPNSPPTPHTAAAGSSSVPATATAEHLSASADTGEFVQVALPSPSRRPESSRRRPSVSLDNASPTKEKSNTTSKHAKKSAGKEHAHASSSSGIPEGLAKFGVEDEENPQPLRKARRKPPKPLRQDLYGIPPAMEKVLGLRHQHSEEEDSGSQSSSNSPAEAVRSPPTLGSKEARTKQRMQQRVNAYLNEFADNMEHAEDREEFRDIEANGAVSRSGSSRGWGQPNAIVVSGGCDKIVRVWDVISGQCIYTLDGHTSTIRTMRVLHNRPIAVTGSRDATLRVWDVQLGRCLHVLEGHDHSVRCLDVHGNKVVSGSYDNTCRLWDIDTGQCIHVLQGHLHQVYSVAFDGVRIASGGLDTTIRIWDAETGQCVALLQGHTSLVCEIHLTPTILATGGSDGGVIAFSLATYQVLYQLKPHESSITSLQLDEQHLVTGGSDGRVKLFETQTGAFVREMSGLSDNVWKVAFGRETCAVMCKRGNRTVVEIWSLGPYAHRVSSRKERFMEGQRRMRHQQREDGAEPDGEQTANLIDEPAGSV